MKRGIYFSILAAIISGFSVFSNGLFVVKSDPVVFAALRNALVSIILSVPLFFVLKKSKLNIRQVPLLILIGIIGGSIPFALFFKGLSLTGGLQANFINKSLFIWVALLAPVFLKERISWLMLIGYGLLFYAAFFASGGQSISNPGAILVLTSTILWAIEYILIKISLRKVHPSVVAACRMLFGIPVLFFIIRLQGLTSEIPTVVLSQGSSLATSALFLTVYMLSLFEALKYAPVTLVTSILVIAPFITAILSNMIRGNPIPENLISQSIINLFGLAILLFSSLRKKSQNQLNQNQNSV